jgi:cytochrome c oxidase cbb3-type subunit 4
MDMNDFRAFYTVLMFAIFVGIFLWAWSGKRRKDFNEAAQLPLDEPTTPRTNNKGGLQ